MGAAVKVIIRAIGWLFARAGKWLVPVAVATTGHYVGWDKVYLAPMQALKVAMRVAWPVLLELLKYFPSIDMEGRTSLYLMRVKNWTIEVAGHVCGFADLFVDANMVVATFTYLLSVGLLCMHLKAVLWFVRVFQGINNKATEKG